MEQPEARLKGHLNVLWGKNYRKRASYITLSDSGCVNTGFLF